MNEFYEHPDVLSMIRNFQSVYHDVSINQLKIRHNLINFKDIFQEYKNSLRNLEEFQDIFELIQKEEFFLEKFDQIKNSLSTLEMIEELSKKIIKENDNIYKELELSILNSKNYLSLKIKFDDDWELELDENKV